MLYVSAIINSIHSANFLLDSACETYGIVKESVVRSQNWEAIWFEKPRQIVGWNQQPTAGLLGLAKCQLDIQGWRKPVTLYISSDAAGYDGILGAGWLEQENVTLDLKDRKARMMRYGRTVHEIIAEDRLKTAQSPRHISAAAYAMWTRKARKDKNIRLFAVSMRDIEQALTIKEPKPINLPDWCRDFQDVFEPREPKQLPPRRQGIDHKIELTKSFEEVAPAKLRPMSREELLILRKTLTELLGKGFIKASASPLAAPVLFAKKPNGGVRFCIDYRALNQIVKRNRFPIPLIQETLREVSGAKVLTKLDISKAFHQIRIAEGDEWMTAFITRYGLYEWTVLPFGLNNGPASFQKLINEILRDLLDQGVTAYIDDILIYSEERKGHRKLVCEVLKRLRAANLQIDFEKCEFEVTRTKYLGVIIEAGKGISMDPAKVQAIREWEIPETLKELRGFLGFASYYRRFISNFSEITAPLTEMTKGPQGQKKNRKLAWEDLEKAAFAQLKEQFIEVENKVLKEWEFDKIARIETDASNWAIGGQLLQTNREGEWAPVAFFSKKMSKSECNYTIHDKELLAVIKALEEWEVELQSAPEVIVVTDHRALEFFQETKPRIERHMRWREFLTQFPIRFEYRPGRENNAADALSRRPQDAPKGEDDPRKMARNTWVIPPKKVTLGRTLEGHQVQPAKGLEELWVKAKEDDKMYQQWIKDLQAGRRQWSIPNQNVSIAECKVINDQIYRRNQILVPEYEPLRTHILQQLHDSPTLGHPGRDALASAIRREFFWPGLTADAARFVRNCDVCGRTRIWREREGLLKPLEIADRPWRHLTMDYIVELPPGLKTGARNILVVVDRLTRGLILTPVKNLTAGGLAEAFLSSVIAHHGIPDSIVSDRGSQFVSRFWKTLCNTAGIELKPSTAYHPQTDGLSERSIQSVKDFIRKMINSPTVLKPEFRAPGAWELWLPMAQLAANNRTNSTGFSPFSLMHGAEARIEIDLPSSRTQRWEPAPERAGKELMERMKCMWDLAQASLAAAQEYQEKASNRHRKPASAYKVGDFVWLSQKNRPSEGKWQPRQEKHQILEVLGSHNYKLDTPKGIHDIFHTDLLRPAGSDPFPSQAIDATQEEPEEKEEILEGADVFDVEAILEERRKGRGHQVLVKWIGFEEPTWEPRERLTKTQAYVEWRRRDRPAAVENSNRGEGGCDRIEFC
jgi:transposase InsO family protein